MKASLLGLSVLGVLIASGYYFIVTSRQFVLHKIVIASFAVRAIGSLFMILHYPGAAEIVLASYIGFAFGGFLLIWTGLRNPTGKPLLYQLVTGILIGMIVINNFVPVKNLEDLVRFSSYPLAAFTGTILLKDTYVHQGEKNMVIMYFIVAIFAVILDVMQTFGILN